MPAVDNKFIVSYPKRIQLGIYRKGKILYSSYIMELTCQKQAFPHLFSLQRLMVTDDDETLGGGRVIDGSALDCQLLVAVFVVPFPVEYLHVFIQIFFRFLVLYIGKAGGLIRPDLVVFVHRA